jgi:CrcB protein
MAGIPIGAVLGLSGHTLFKRVALVAAGGAVGSVARYLVALWTAQQFGATFPWGTLSVNVIGSFLIGLLATLADELGAMGPDVRVLLIVGVLGGFTTFSSFSLETLRLAEQHELARTAAYFCASIALSFAAAIAGIALGRLFNR